jgi:adenosylcobinamide kinase/adenosylcobinamide-phosphate guanylyltransferase
MKQAPQLPHEGPGLRELVLGGQKSGKSQHAENRAAAWLQAKPAHQATLLATATAGDAEMAQRIARHQAERAARVPGLATQELATGPWRGDLATAIQTLSQAHHLLVVDCLTLWLTAKLMPLHGPGLDDDRLAEQSAALVQALRAAPGPVVCVSNEIGLGVSPLGAETRRFIDHLGRLHQQAAAACGRVSLLVAGCVWTVKEPL